jgi:hypothetical protein
LQIAEQRKAYVEKKNEEVKMWERSYEDLEITAREFEKEVSLPHLLFLLVLIRHFSLFLKNGFFCYFSQGEHHEGRSRTSKEAARKNRSGAAECQATIASCDILWESRELPGRWNS